MSLVELKFRKDGPVLTQAFGKIKTIQDTRIFFQASAKDSSLTENVHAKNLILKLMLEEIISLHMQE
jgi:hypothetical protein